MRSTDRSINVGSHAGHPPRNFAVKTQHLIFSKGYNERIRNNRTDKLGGRDRNLGQKTTGVALEKVFLIHTKELNLNMISSVGRKF